VHADPSIEALFASSFAPASSNFQGKTISESGTIAQSKIFNQSLRPSDPTKERGLARKGQPLSARSFAPLRT